MADWATIRSHGAMSPRTLAERERGLQRLVDVMLQENEGMSRVEAEASLRRQQKIGLLREQTYILERELNREFGSDYYGDNYIGVSVKDDSMVAAYVHTPDGPIKFNAEHIDVFPSQTLLTQLTLLFK